VNRQFHACVCFTRTIHFGCSTCDPLEYEIPPTSLQDGEVSQVPLGELVIIALLPVLMLGLVVIGGRWLDVLKTATDRPGSDDDGGTQLVRADRPRHQPVAREGFDGALRLTVARLD
jgi:hypothetical protein